MNPVTAQGLDPKLKEAYDRVMGTQVSPQPAPAKPIEPATVPVQPAASTTSPQSAPAAEAAPAADANQHVYVATPAAGGTTSTVVAKKGRKISPIIFIAGGIVFFLGYTAIWLKVFGII